MNAFIKLGVIEPLAQALYQQGIRIPTVIQQASIPAIFKGKDIIGRSETGTGKTLAYLLPLVQRVDVKKGGTQVLIMTPTRELAKQIFDVLRPFAILMEADVADIIGGRTIENQIQKLKREPHIIIGTPGRLLDHIRRRSLDLSGVKTVVLDEADQMLAAGFREDIDALVDETSKKRQVLLFSATMPPEAKKLAHKYMKSAVVVDVAEKAVASTVEQRVYETVKTHKFSLLVRHLKEMNPYMAVVFCNTREGAHELAGRLQEETDLVVDEIHGNMSQGQRNQVIREFEKARTQVLVASDIAARGLDVEGITHVFNYEFPAIWNTIFIGLAVQAEREHKGSPSLMQRLKISCCFANWKRQSRKSSRSMMKKGISDGSKARPLRKRLSCPVCTNRQRKKNIRCLDIKGLT